MLRKTLNASRLQAEVSRRLHRLQEVIDDGVKFAVPRPQRQTADRTGCNWTMKHVGNAGGFEAVIADVLAQVQAEYNLPANEEEDEHEAREEGTGAPDPFGTTRSTQPTNPFGGATGSAAKSNPFGEAASPVTKQNPFGDAGPRTADDPFRSEEADAPAQKRPANPFGD